MLNVAARNFRYIGDLHRAELGALEATRRTAGGDYVPPGEWARYVRASSYYAAIDRFGSPALAVARLPTAQESARMAADEVLVQGGQVMIAPRAPEPACDTPAHTDLVVPTGSAITLSNPLPGPVELRLRRFADQFRIMPASSWRPVTA